MFANDKVRHMLYCMQKYSPYMIFRNVLIIIVLDEPLFSIFFHCLFLGDFALAMFDIVIE